MDSREKTVTDVKNYIEEHQNETIRLQEIA